MRIAVVIVTFNRLLMLKNSVDAVTNQTHRPDLIIVVDNNSTDGTQQWVSELASTRSDIIPVQLDKNYGGAGGFHYGIKEAFERGANWIWTMDDDSVPEPDALERLLDRVVHNTGRDSWKVGFFASRVNWKDGNPHVMNVPGPVMTRALERGTYPGLTSVIYASFVSILISRVAVEQVGLPIKEFFIYCDDVEYTRRITSAGFYAFYVEASRVTHLTPTNTGVSFQEMDVTSESFLKWKSAIRNLVAVNRRRKYGWLREPLRLGYIFYRLARTSNPWSIKFTLMTEGVRGLFLNYEKWIEYPSPMK